MLAERVRAIFELIDQRLMETCDYFALSFATFRLFSPLKHMQINFHIGNYNFLLILTTISVAQSANGPIFKNVSSPV